MKIFSKKVGFRNAMTLAIVNLMQYKLYLMISEFEIMVKFRLILRIEGFLCQTTVLVRTNMQ